MRFKRKGLWRPADLRRVAIETQACRKLGKQFPTGETDLSDTVPDIVRNIQKAILCKIRTLGRIESGCKSHRIGSSCGRTVVTSY